VTIELLVYLYLVLLALLFAILKLNILIFNIFTFANLICFSIVVRSIGFDADMGNYAQYLSYKSFSIYYIKEPVYWIGSRFIFEWTDSAFFVFVFYDVIFYIALLYTSTKLKLPKYFPYLVILFFPTVLGMQNVFRQFIASGFLFVLLALIFSQKEHTFKSKVFILLIASLSHNSALLFAPIIFIKKSNSKVSLLFIITAIFIFMLLPVAAGTKSDSNTGDVPPFLYLVIYTCMLLTYLGVMKFNFKKFPLIYNQYFYMLIYFWFLILLSIFTLGGAQSKRLGMLSLLLSLIPLVSLIELRFRPKLLARLLFIFVLVLPTLVFHNARSLLQTTEMSLQKEAELRSMGHHK
jgi:hypothetical protein